MDDAVLLCLLLLILFLLLLSSVPLLLLPVEQSPLPGPGKEAHRFSANTCQGFQQTDGAKRQRHKLGADHDG